jgi:hypothetical protein
MIDSATRDAAYSALILLKKRNDRCRPPLLEYIDALEKELGRYNARLSRPVVAHLEDFEKLTAATEAAEAAKAPEKLPVAPSSSAGVLEALAVAEAQAAAEAATKPWWKFWGASSGGECACAKKALAALPAAKEETK